MYLFLCVRMATGFVSLVLASCQIVGQYILEDCFAAMFQVRCDYQPKNISSIHAVSLSVTGEKYINISANWHVSFAHSHR